MKNNLVLQVNINLATPENRFPVLDHLLEDSVTSARSYAKKLNADYHQFIGPRFYPYYSVCMEKFCVYDKKFENYEKIFLLDTDTIIHNECPNIFIYNEFSARPEPETRHKKKILKNLLIDNLEHNYFNSGVILFTRDFLSDTKKYVEQLSEIKLCYDKKELDFYDQRIFNSIVSKRHIKYNELEYSWNCVPHYTGTHYITHYMHPWKKKYKGKTDV